MKYEKPTREQVVALYKKIKSKNGWDRKTTLSHLAESAGVSPNTANHWITGYRDCTPACWRCLRLDWDRVPIERPKVVKY